MSTSMNHDRDDIDDIKKGYVDEPQVETLHATLWSDSKHPPIQYTSVGAFTSSFNHRMKSVWTKRFVLSLLAGQVVSLCITCTNVTTTELVSRNWVLPTTQTFFL